MEFGFRLKIPSGIRGHRPKSSLGDKILAIREGDYKNCFWEGEGKHLLGYGKNMGRNFLSPDVFTKIWKRPFFCYFFSKSLKMFNFFAATGRGEPWKIFFLCYWGGSKIALGRGTVF